MIKKNKPQRIDPSFEKAMRECAKVRVDRGLANLFKRDQISLREMTHLATRTQSWGALLKELKTKPKKKNE